VFTRGLHEVADGVWAYLQPDGSWGYSNAGLVAGDGTSLLVDTLFDLRLTRDMLDAMRSATESRPIGVVVNTHANGDHTYGNQLVAGARIIASEAASEEMDDVPPALMHTFKDLDIGEDGNRLVASAFGPFRFDDIEPVPPTESFTGSMTVDVGGTTVVLDEVGPAHTAGDVIAWLPDARVVFTGDILFHDSTPIMWSGPIGNWIAACRRIRELDPAVVVPGHGALADTEGVLRSERYFEWIERETVARYGAGMTALDAAWDLELGEYADWGDWERTIVTVDSIYAGLDPDHKRLNAVQAFQEMGRYKASKHHA
jgi:glyoxylase-like metal-dependent hydrolase (beta-lactamase superfamily II)